MAATEGRGPDEEDVLAELKRLRGEWPPGPWDQEPDRVEWSTETGYPGLIVRSPFLGVLCGYVGLPPGHPAHGRRFHDEMLSRLKCHGGLNYAAPCNQEVGVCHEVAPGEEDHRWWVGFDCGHGYDFQPAVVARINDLVHLLGDTALFQAKIYPEGLYRDLAYVRNWVERLAQQLREIAVKTTNALP